MNTRRFHALGLIFLVSLALRATGSDVQNNEKPGQSKKRYSECVKMDNLWVKVVIREEPGFIQANVMLSKAIGSPPIRTSDVNLIVLDHEGKRCKVKSMLHRESLVEIGGRSLTANAVFSIEGAKIENLTVAKPEIFKQFLRLKLSETDPGIMTIHK